MIGDHGAIYCDRCERLEEFYWTIFVKQIIGDGDEWVAWWEVCRECLQTQNDWLKEKRTGKTNRGSNKRRLRWYRFNRLMREQEGQSLRSHETTTP